MHKKKFLNKKYIFKINIIILDTSLLRVIPYPIRLQDNSLLLCFMYTGMLNDIRINNILLYCHA